MGISNREGYWVVAPFRPSATLDNLLRERCAVINHTDDVRVFAGCLTGHRDWPVADAEAINSPRLTVSLAHTEVEVEAIEEDKTRPRFLCRAVHSRTHAPFRGFNRAQSAVIEAAILVSRLDRLPWEKIESEVRYLSMAIDKAAGPREQQAWEWLMAAIEAHRRSKSDSVA
jgi:hypothetical protein